MIEEKELFQLYLSNPYNIYIIVNYKTTKNTLSKIYDCNKNISTDIIPLCVCEINLLLLACV